MNVEDWFAPKLEKKYSIKFDEIVDNLKNNQLIENNKIIGNEIKKNINFNDIETLKYKASLSALKDLLNQGWIIESNKKIILNTDKKDKEQIKKSLNCEVENQFYINSNVEFIKKMEELRIFNNEPVSIKNLIGDKNDLIHRIKNKQSICKPYVQLVTNTVDQFTGYKLSDIWRYFRYTWSIPYKNMPGRNIFYLVRDSGQKYHPVMGIFALGNSVLNLTVRDSEIGWTLNALKKNLELNGEQYANRILPLLEKNVENALNDVYKNDFKIGNDYREVLGKIAIEQKNLAINNKIDVTDPDFEEEAKKPLFKKKRAEEIVKLLSAKEEFSKKGFENNLSKLEYMLNSKEGKQALTLSLISNRKNKIGSNMMEIIVCGSIPPYNELLGGKLVSILACSPQVIRDYTNKYKNQISEIASRMKGSKVVRDSHLVYLGTTSLYSIGSSQYNRIKCNLSNGNKLEFKRLGLTEGYGTVYFSNETSQIFSNLLEKVDGGKKNNHVFGEGTSPKLRIISKGLNTLGIKSNAFLQHYSPRIVYSINLAKNTNEFLMGLEEKVDYGYDLGSIDEVNKYTQELINFWYERWLKMRLNSVDIVDRLSKFDIEKFLVGNKIRTNKYYDQLSIFDFINLDSNKGVFKMNMEGVNI